MDHGLLGASEAPRILGVNRAAVINWVGRSVFPSIRYQVDGRTSVWRLRRGDILAYVRRSRIRAANEGDDPGPSGG